MADGGGREARSVAMIEAEVLGQRLELETLPGLFSPRHADRGTLAMLSRAHFEPGMRVLDLGCGCGLVGIVAARICGEANVSSCPHVHEAENKKIPMKNNILFIFIEVFVLVDNVDFLVHVPR